MESLVCVKGKEGLKQRLVHNLCTSIAHSLLLDLDFLGLSKISQKKIKLILKHIIITNATMHNDWINI